MALQKMLGTLNEYYFQLRVSALPSHAQTEPDSWVNPYKIM